MFANGPDTNPLNDCPNSTVMDLAYDFDSQLVMGDSPNSLLMSESTDSTIMDVTPVPRVISPEIEDLLDTELRDEIKYFNLNSFENHLSEVQGQCHWCMNLLDGKGELPWANESEDTKSTQAAKCWLRLACCYALLYQSSVINGGSQNPHLYKVRAENAYKNAYRISVACDPPHEPLRLRLAYYYAEFLFDESCRLEDAGRFFKNTKIIHESAGGIFDKAREASDTACSILTEAIVEVFTEMEARGNADPLRDSWSHRRLQKIWELLNENVMGVPDDIKQKAALLELPQNDTPDSTVMDVVPVSQIVSPEIEALLDTKLRDELNFIHLNNIKHTIKYYDWCEEIINGPISDSYWATQEKHIQAAHCWLRLADSYYFLIINGSPGDPRSINIHDLAENAYENAYRIAIAFNTPSTHERLFHASYYVKFLFEQSGRLQNTGDPSHRASRILFTNAISISTSAIMLADPNEIDWGTRPVLRSIWNLLNKNLLVVSRDVREKADLLDL